MEKSKAWRAKLETFKNNKALTGIAETMDEALDGMVAQSLHMLKTTNKQGERLDHLDEGAVILHEHMEAQTEEAKKQAARMDDLEEEQKISRMKVDDNTKKSKIATANFHRAELEKSQNVVIARGVFPVTGADKERYDDLEKAVAHVFRTLKVPNLRINHVKRLQKVATDESSGPATMRIELASKGEKVKLFQAIEETIKKRTCTLTATFSNEVPQYAMNAFKYLSRVAALMRRNDSNLKTRVNILRGDIWPSIQIKQRNERKYHPCPDDLFERSKTEFNRKSKEEQEKKRKQKEQAGALESTMNKMVINTATDSRGKQK